jgi:polysaccharide biosynthesis transport protein
MPDPRENLNHLLPESVTALVPQTPDGYSGISAKGGLPSMHLRDYWRMILNHRRVIAWIVGVWMFLATLQMLFTPNFYVAKTTVEVDPESPLLQLPTDGMDANAISTYPVYLNTELQILRSPALLNQVVKALDLEHDPSFRMHMIRGGHTIRRILRLGYVGPRDPGEAAGGEFPLTTSLKPATTADVLREEERLRPYVADIQKKFLVEQVKELGTVTRDTRLVAIVYSDPNPVLAAKISNGIADALVEFNQGKRDAIGKATQQFLARRTTELKTQIRDGEQQLATYAKSRNILTLDPGQNTALDRLGVLNRQLVEAENESRFAKAIFDALRDSGAADAQAEQDAKQIVDARGSLAALREKRAQLLVGTTEKWPETQEVNEQIAELEKYIGETRQRATSVALTNYQTKYRAAFAREQNLRETFDKQRAVMVNQDEAAVTYHLMQQEIDSNKVLLAGLLGRLGANDLLQASTTNNIRVVDYSGVPNRDEPMGPFRLINLAAVFFLAFGLAIVVAFVLEYLNSTLRSPADVEGILQLPALGSIPSLSGPRKPLLSFATLHLRSQTRGTDQK